MADAPQSLDAQVLAQKAQLESKIRELESQLMGAKEAYLKVLGALEYSAIQKKDAEGPIEGSEAEDVTSE